MINEIIIILEEGTSNKAKGNCFENLIRNLISTQDYKVKGNIHFGGMEIDLLAVHKYTYETLYVECKAKEKVKADELSKFAFNVDFKEVDKGFFFRTKELEQQAGALLNEIKSKPKYNKLTFFEPNEIIKMLVDRNFLNDPQQNLKSFNISKRILAITYFGDYFIYLINESTALPTKIIIINAQNNDKTLEKQQIAVLKENISEIKDLEIIKKPLTYLKSTDSNNVTEMDDISIESISEVQESENWYDYLPASSKKKHFVGRDEIRTKIMKFFSMVANNKTEKRIFYLNGKSGWGKSSLVLELKNRCRNKYYKNRFYALAIDTRSANSDNFVALSLKKLINKAFEEGFLKKNLFSSNINFTSNTDLLSSDSIIKFFEELRVNNKSLILIFDQFEDVFRKKDFFKTFYKFLSDVTDKKPNLIIGFSWKTDFFIHNNDPSYHIWQQAKEQAVEFTVAEFGEKEINGIIKQLETTVGELSVSIKNRIIESSQGLPWLTKKLCIHIFNQIESGIDKEKLLESNLNISDLFKKDLENLESKELKALRIIAKRAYDGNFFDESEVGDLIDGETISSLIHKRLIIRSGANYNIYWDIFRDYIVTKEIPTIGESYLLRQGVNLCLEVFLLFVVSEKDTVETLLKKHPKNIGQETLTNILIELRNIGLVQKENDLYFVPDNIDITKEGFVDFITKKFQNYTPYLNLKKSGLNKISKQDVIHTLKSIFKQEYQDNTWDAYAKNLINWFLISDLDIKSKLAIPHKGRGKEIKNISISDIKDFIPKSSLKEIIEAFPFLIMDKSTVNSKFYRDFFLLEIINDKEKITDYGYSLSLKEEEELKKELKVQILKLPKMKILKDLYEKNNKPSAKQILNMLSSDFFNGLKQSSKLIYATKALTWIK